VIDECQDFDIEWVQALSAELSANGRLYVLGDSNQQLYEREPFDLPHAVRMECNDNFRSSQKVVHAINQLQLIEQRIEACSAHEGETPGFHTYAGNVESHDKALNNCLKALWASGYTPAQVAVVSFRGVKNSRVLAMEQLGGHRTRRTTGQYDQAGNAMWHEGELLVESVYRFKGQSAPVVVLCEVDFEELSPVNARKLFVGMTRGQVRVEVVLSEIAATVLQGQVFENNRIAK
jgi:superfamily I DNA and RNA helicase